MCTYKITFAPSLAKTRYSTKNEALERCVEMSQAF